MALIGRLLFDFRGRISREMWWLSKVALIAVPVLLALMIGWMIELLWYFVPVSRFDTVDALDSPLGSIVGAMVVLSWFWTSTVLNIKRFHDRNLSGWLLLVGLIPVIGAIFNFVHLGFLRGDSGRNRYGSPPPQSLKEWWEC